MRYQHSFKNLSGNRGRQLLPPLEPLPEIFCACAIEASNTWYEISLNNATTEAQVDQLRDAHMRSIKRERGWLGEGEETQQAEVPTDHS